MRDSCVVTNVLSLAHLSRAVSASVSLVSGPRLTEA